MVTCRFFLHYQYVNSLFNVSIPNAGLYPRAPGISQHVTTVMNAMKEQYDIHCTSFPLPSTSGKPKRQHSKTTSTPPAPLLQARKREAATWFSSRTRTGGMVANSAIQGFTSPRGESSHGRVVGLVLIASALLADGSIDIFHGPVFPNIAPPTWRVDRETGERSLFTPPRRLFYHDMPGEEAEGWVKQRTKHESGGAGCLRAGNTRMPGWQDVPVWYVGTVFDQGLPVVVQRVHVGLAMEMGAAVVHGEVRSGHSPF